jgi:hypothetical protein
MRPFSKHFNRFYFGLKKKSDQPLSLSFSLSLPPSYLRGAESRWEFTNPAAATTAIPLLLFRHPRLEVTVVPATRLSNSPTTAATPFAAAAAAAASAAAAWFLSLVSLAAAAAPTRARQKLQNDEKNQGGDED